MTPEQEIHAAFDQLLKDRTVAIESVANKALIEGCGIFLERKIALGGITFIAHAHPLVPPGQIVEFNDDILHNFLKKTKDQND